MKIIDLTSKYSNQYIKFKYCQIVKFDNKIGIAKIAIFKSKIGIFKSIKRRKNKSHILALT